MHRRPEGLRQSGVTELVGIRPGSGRTKIKVVLLIVVEVSLSQSRRHYPLFVIVSRAASIMFIGRGRLRWTWGRCHNRRCLNYWQMLL